MFNREAIFGCDERKSHSQRSTIGVPIRMIQPEISVHHSQKQPRDKTFWILAQKIFYILVNIIIVDVCGVALNLNRDLVLSSGHKTIKNQGFLVFSKRKPLIFIDFLGKTSLQESFTADTLTAGQVAPPAKAASTSEVEDQVFISHFDSHSCNVAHHIYSS